MDQMKNGFTLIEIIVFVVIVAVLLGLLISKNTSHSGSSGNSPTPTSAYTQAAVAACYDKLPAAACSYTNDDGTIISGICRLLSANVNVCAPN